MIKNQHTTLLCTTTSHKSLDRITGRETPVLPQHRLAMESSGTLFFRRKGTVCAVLYVTL